MNYMCAFGFMRMQLCNVHMFEICLCKLDLNKGHDRSESVLLYCTMMYVCITKNDRFSIYSKLLNDSMAVHSWSAFYSN